MIERNADSPGIPGIPRAGSEVRSFPVDLRERNADSHGIPGIHALKRKKTSNSDRGIKRRRSAAGSVSDSTKLRSSACELSAVTKSIGDGRGICGESYCSILHARPCTELHHRLVGTVVIGSPFLSKSRACHCWVPLDKFRRMQPPPFFDSNRTAIQAITTLFLQHPFVFDG